MATTEYSLNGVNVQIEYPDRLMGQPRRAAWGTLVRQSRDTWNWFHLAPTTPVNGVSAVGSFQMWLYRISLNAELENAAITDVHVRNGADLIWQLRDPSRLPIASQIVREQFPSERTSFRSRGVVSDVVVLAGYGGFSLSVRISFAVATGGQVIFRSALFSYYQFGG